MAKVPIMVDEELKWKLKEGAAKKKKKSINDFVKFILGDGE